LSRFVVGMRSVLAVTAGIGRYPAGKMLVYSTISYLIFTAIVMYAAMKLVENMEVILYYIRTYDRTVWTLAILLVAGLLAAKIISVRRSGVK
ncbi:MAG: hypothetical protein HY770_05140, partial [Chitinivibrionia bacterium]|nr:hypothetical protein [Chitinivibrionia bacterium]